MDARISEALEELNNQAREKKEEIQRLIAEKYTNLQDVVMTGTRTMISEHPMLFAGSVASGFLLIGFLLGRGSKR